HARFSANERQYLYRISNRRPRPALEAGRVWWVPVMLDVEAMNDAAQILLGNHDFTSFRATNCQAKTAVKTLDELTVSRVGEEIHLKVRARSFLHHQVRNMTGSLKMVGEGRWSKSDLQDVLAARDRSRGGQTAPADGLYLVHVQY
ncbi:MAG: tRNA pseudouridine synthase A, partial [Rhodospirillaceae bacterium]|nr:tRNA pseudouridine synthase A [Rhodospirillaceae bacterium]